MAPEQIEAAEVDAKSDVFAAGILLWELTLGRRLFDGATDSRRSARRSSSRSHGRVDRPVLSTGARGGRARRTRTGPRSPARSASELAAGLRAFLRTQPAIATISRR